MVVHHTATRNDLTAQEMEQSMKSTYKVIVPTHYIIDKRGNSIRSNNREVNVWAISKDKYNTDTQVTEANLYGIHIELVGNFNEHAPTTEQYDRLNILIAQIEARRIKEGIINKLVIKSHSDFASKNCPWKLFDFNKLGPQTDTKRKITQYTPCAGSPINDSEAQGWSCDVAASGLPLINEYAGKMWACPIEYSIGKNGGHRTVLQIEWADWERYDFECVDRWSAITGQHLDLFVGLWSVGDTNYKEWVYKNLQGYRNVRQKK